MIHLVEASKWAFKTSGSGGFSIDIVAATGGIVELFDPTGKEQHFYYGGVGAGISTPGLKVPKLGSVVGRLLTSRALNGSGGTTGMWNTGTVYKTAVVGNRELTRGDFTGGAVLADLGVSTPIKGLVGTVMLVGLDPLMMISLLTNPLIVLAELLLGRGPALAPKAMIDILGDSRGLVAGGNAYVGYMR
ncbi:hypothetical protein KZX46_09495 [Polymorphobacter sp. PAMC 29334]|uniref:hypothetical protein n=1 Tax=Polymorphobacter sp. PAMC 29334 TaxID=2862331 RepID=UPI001C77BBD9|nr:hypothetical protein [Polymorphobacter sp. PAMC 29334]QYE36141.1 hypothetical protein KZX46_09495 [Polymorphobacter sp. PAMC 29334]